MSLTSESYSEKVFGDIPTHLHSVDDIRNKDENLLPSVRDITLKSPDSVEIPSLPLVKNPTKRLSTNMDEDGENSSPSRIKKFFSSLPVPSIFSETYENSAANMASFTSSPARKKRGIVLKECAYSAPIQLLGSAINKSISKIRVLEGEDAPLSFEKIRRNAYVIKVLPRLDEVEMCNCLQKAQKRRIDLEKAKNERLSDDELSKIFRCDEECINRRLNLECTGGPKIPPFHPQSKPSSSKRSSCGIGASCGNRALSVGKSPKYEIKPTPGKGYGFFAKQDIPAGSFIIEYVGEIIDAAMQNERFAQAAAVNESHYYMMEIDANQIIDARHRANDARFINHSCGPNAELQRWEVNGYTRIGIFAIKDIKKGEEVAYDYQFSTQEETRCHCGTPECRQYLGANVAQKKKAELSLEKSTLPKPQKKITARRK